MFLYISAYNLYKNFTWLIIPEIVLFSINCKRASPPPIISFDTTGSVFLFRFLNGTTSAKQRDRVVHCDVASRDSYFPFDSYPSHSRARLRYFIGVPTRLESSSTPRATLLSFALPSSSSPHLALEFSKRKRETERERRQSFVRWKLSENKSGVYRSMYNLIDLYIYIHWYTRTVSWYYRDYCSWKSNFY